MNSDAEKDGPGASWTKAQEIVEGLRDLSAALEAGEPLKPRFTVKKYRITPPPEYRQDGVRRVRSLLGLSQVPFAAFLGVDVSTVRSWEQGTRSPSPIACRMLSEIEAEPDHWRRRLAACLAESRPTEAPRRTRGTTKRSSRAS